MLKLMTLCPNIATALTISVWLTSTVFAQEPVSILQRDSLSQPLAIPEFTEASLLEAPFLEAPGRPEPIREATSLDDINVLTRGPLHEAFASAHQPDPQSSTVVLQAPPESIDELPPEYKPEGKNVQWISGYWAWDDAQSDFIWISGIWRDVPPNRRWMPGYWDTAGTGHRWVSGFWLEETQQELGYLPEPPASIDQGPSSLAPSEEHFYVPGNWQFEDEKYRWLAGHWQPVVENWIWVPARYVWTPNGCVYQSGYWDYKLENRGTCFAPIHFTQPVYLANNYSYRPSHAINLNTDFMTHLFVRANCGHYFYGDWYASSFNNLGYRPWVSYTSHFRNYDPLLAYYSSRRSSFDNRYNVVQYLAGQHNFYINNRDFRPRPTYKTQYNHALKIQQRHGSRGRNNDYVLKSSYVRKYQDLRKHDAQHRSPTGDIRHQTGRQHYDIKRHRKVAEEELRNNRRKQDQLAQLQRDRKRKEHAGHNALVRTSHGKDRIQSKPSSRERDQDLLRTVYDRPRQATGVAQRPDRKPELHAPTVKHQSHSKYAAQIDQALRSRHERERRSQQENALRSQKQTARNYAAKKAQKDFARKAQQDQARRAQQDKAQRAQHESQRRVQQQNLRTNITGNTSGKMRMQNIPSILQREQAARKAQQDSARKALQDQARRAQQDQARRAQQENARRAQQQSARHSITGNTSGKMRMQNIPSIKQREQAARQAQQTAARRAQQDQARRAQQDAARKFQQDQARRAQQDRARQQASQRARQQQAQRDSARKSQQKAQQDAARRAQKSSQASKQKSPQQSRSSRLRNRSSNSKRK